MRWVLGEQGQHALRAKKTEDVIFSGGQGRAPAGMAEATLTFDNADGWLPIAFAEVTVTRRAFRSGENQYLINGRRVASRTSPCSPPASARATSSSARVWSMPPSACAPRSGAVSSSMPRT